MSPTLYDILGVAPDATPAEIKRAWRDAAERFEPGSGGSPAQFRLFNEAAETLLDPERRQAYDASLAQPGAGAPASGGTSSQGSQGSPGSPVSPASAGRSGGTATATVPVTAPEESAPRWTDRLLRRRTAGATSAGSQEDRGSLADHDGTGGAGDTDTDGTDGADGGEAPRAPRRAVRWPVLAGLAVLAVVLVALAAGPFVPGLGLGAVREVAAQDTLDDARRAAPAAAERAVEAILAYDYRSLEADRDAAARFMTPDYRQEYVETFDKTILDAAPQLKARVTADVRASGVSLATEDRVEVLLFVNQTTVSTANEGEEQRALNRVMVTMQRSAGGTWLVDDLTSY